MSVSSAALSLQQHSWKKEGNRKRGREGGRKKKGRKGGRKERKKKEDF